MEVVIRGKTAAKADEAPVTSDNTPLENQSWFAIGSVNGQPTIQAIIAPGQDDLLTPAHLKKTYQDLLDTMKALGWATTTAVPSAPQRSAGGNSYGNKPARPVGEKKIVPVDMLGYQRIVSKKDGKTLHIVNFYGAANAQGKIDFYPVASLFLGDAKAIAAFEKHFGVLINELIDQKGDKRREGEKDWEIVLGDVIFVEIELGENVVGDKTYPANKVLRYDVQD